LVRRVVGVHGAWFCFVEALEEGLVLCTSFLPVRAVGERRRDVLNLILHLNGGLQMGHFDVGGVEDRVVFQTTVRVERSRHEGAEIVASAVSSHMAFVEIHIPLFQSVERGVSTVSEAVDVLLGWMTEGGSGEEDWLSPCFGRN